MHQPRHQHQGQRHRRAEGLRHGQHGTEHNQAARHRGFNHAKAKPDAASQAKRNANRHAGQETRGRQPAALPAKGRRPKPNRHHRRHMIRAHQRVQETRNQAMLMPGMGQRGGRAKGKGEEGKGGQGKAGQGHGWLL
jgi:hypothetical protein